MTIPIDKAVISSHLRSPIDVFVCSASFEDRCRVVAERLNRATVSRALVCENENHRDLHGENPKRLMEHFGQVATLVPLDTTSPLVTADSFETALSEVLTGRVRNVVVDVTAFTHEALLILLRLLAQAPDSVEIHGVYAKASEYSVGLPLKEKWLSKGVAGVRSVLGFPGEFAPGRPLHLIVMVGFEDERAVELIREFEPSMVSLGYSDGPLSSGNEHLRRNEHSLRTVTAVYGDALTFRFPVYSPLGAKDVLLEQAKKSPGHNVVVAALNTKLSTVGAALAAMQDETIQLCYAQAVFYNFLRYSSPSDEVILVPLGEYIRSVSAGSLARVG